MSRTLKALVCYPGSSSFLGLAFGEVAPQQQDWVPGDSEIEPAFGMSNSFLGPIFNSPGSPGELNRRPSDNRYP